MTEFAEQAVIDFYTYPSVGCDDWRYTFQTAHVRALEIQMLSRAALLDMANAENLQQAADFLSGTEYALPTGGRNFAEVENILQQRRTAVRQLFADLMLDKPVVELFKTRDDFANLRLAVRRAMTEKPVGDDYSDDGNIPADKVEKIFSETEQFIGNEIPDCVRDALERAVLDYYENKDIRQIDYAVDKAQAEYNLKIARKINNIFLIGLFGIQIDMTNIRTMLRLKFTESEERKVFLEGGFIETEQFVRGLDIGYETLGSLFFATPYFRIVEAGTNYLVSDKSFLKVEQQCEEYLTGFLKSTAQITAGPQPVIAYLLMKENEIRTIRLILTAKKNFLDTRLVLDRIT